MGVLDDNKISARDRVSEVAPPALLACGVAFMIALLAIGNVGETAGLALVLILSAVGGGVIFAAVLKVIARAYSGLT